MNNFDIVSGFFAGCPTDQFIELFYIHPTTKETSCEYVPVGNRQRLQAALEHAQKKNDNDYGVYFGVCPRTRTRATRGNETDVDTIVGFWTELDSVKEDRLPLDDLMKLQDGEMPPSLCVLSGGGVHAYWLFGQPYKMGQDERRDIKAALKGVGKAFGGDGAVAEFARVMRVPGFANTKPGRDRAPVETVLPKKRTRYEIADLLKYKPVEPVRKPKPRVEVQQTDDPLQYAQLALDALNFSRCENYHEWVEIGQCLQELGEPGLSLWDTWSSKSSKYHEGDCQEKWNTFRGSGRSIGSLYYYADLDRGTSWRPKKTFDLKMEKPQEWPKGIPMIVRGWLNRVTYPSTAPLLELWYEAISKGLIKRDQIIYITDLQKANIALGRGLTDSTIREGIKQGSNPLGVQYLRVIAVIKDSKNVDSPPSSMDNISSPTTPKNLGGRPPEGYKLLLTPEILNNLLNVAMGPLIEMAFPKDRPLVAPVRAEFVAALNDEETDKIVETLKEQYGAIIESQRGFEQAMKKAQGQYRSLEYQLRNPEFAPIPDGMTYKNTSEYTLCCIRAIMLAHDGETQYNKTQWAMYLGCVEKNVNMFLKRADVEILKNQTIDLLVKSIEDVKNAGGFSKEANGYPKWVISGASTGMIKITDRQCIKWCEGELEKGATLSIRYTQPNRQRYPAQKPSGEAEDMPEGELLPKDETPVLLDAPVVKKPKKQSRPRSKPKSYAEDYQEKLVNLVAKSKNIPVKIDGKIVINKQTGEHQLTLDFLLNRGTEPEKIEEQEALQDAQLPKQTDTDAIVAWMVNDLGGTVSAIHEAGSAEYAKLAS